MADLILQAQRTKSVNFIWGAKEKENDFIPMTHKSLPPRAYRDMLWLSPTSSVQSTGGGQLQYMCPNNNGLLKDTCVAITFANTTSGTYVSTPAFNVINLIDCSHSANQLNNYVHQDYLQVLLSESSYDEKQLIIQAAGGSSPSGTPGTVIVPLGAFWTEWDHDPRDTHTVGLPLFDTGKNLIYTLNINALNTMLTSGATGGGITNIQLGLRFMAIEQSQVDLIKQDIASKNFRVFSFDIQSLPLMTVPTATDTQYLANALQGSISKLFYVLRLASDITANNLLINKLPTSGHLDINGTRIWTLTYGANEIYITKMFGGNSKTTGDSNLGFAPCISFSSLPDQDFWCGDLNAFAFNDITMNITHALGSNATFNVVGLMNRYYQYADGAFIRIK